jgi:hypothetical protein
LLCGLWTVTLICGKDFRSDKERLTGSWPVAVKVRVSFEATAEDLRSIPWGVLAGEDCAARWNGIQSAAVRKKIGSLVNRMMGE